MQTSQPSSPVHGPALWQFRPAILMPPGPALPSGLLLRNMTLARRGGCNPALMIVRQEGRCESEASLGCAVRPSSKGKKAPSHTPTHLPEAPPVREGREAHPLQFSQTTRHTDGPVAWRVLLRVRWPIPGPILVCFCRYHKSS